MESPDTEKILNPDIRKIQIGIREMRELTVYPLSISDQFQASDLITEGLQAFLKSGDKPDMEFVAGMVDLVREKLQKILALTCDREDLGEDVYSELTNNQAVAIAEAVYEVNYEVLGKKVTSLLEKIPPSLSGRSLPPFSGDILNTDSKISTENLGEKEG